MPRQEWVFPTQEKDEKKSDYTEARLVKIIIEEICNNACRPEFFSVPVLTPL